jgi:hypothetical protein
MPFLHVLDRSWLAIRHTACSRGESGWFVRTARATEVHVHPFETRQFEEAYAGTGGCTQESKVTPALAALARGLHGVFVPTGCCRTERCPCEKVDYLGPQFSPSRSTHPGPRGLPDSTRPSTSSPPAWGAVVRPAGSCSLRPFRRPVGGPPRRPRKPSSLSIDL